MKLLAMTVILVLLLSYCALKSLGQHCQSDAEDRSGDCSVLSEGGSCRKQHPEQQDLEYCSNTISNSELYNKISNSIAECNEQHFIDEENLTNLHEIELLPIEIHSVDISRFSLKISWHHLINFNMKYNIIVLIDGLEEYYSSCNSNGSIHIYHDELYYYNLEDFHISLKVTIIPEFKIFNSTSRSVRWPTSCLDTDFYSSSTCGPPILNSPKNITATEVCDPTTDNFTILITWDQEVVIFAFPIEYYIRIFSHQKVGNISLDYGFLARGTNSVLIQVPHHLNYSLVMRAFSNCSGIANYSSGDLNFGCGIKSDPVSVEPCPEFTTPIPTTLTTDSTELTPTTPMLHITNIVPYVIVGSSTFTFLIVILILLSIFLICFCNAQKRKNTETVIIDGLVPAPVDFSVFLMHSPQDNSMKDIQTYVVCPLQKFFDVATSGDKMCGDLIEWIEVQVRQRTAVLFVFTKEFCSEWEGDEAKSQVVQAAQRLLTSAVAQELLDKYAIIVLDEEAKEKFIPDNHFLKSMSVYVLGRKKSEIESLYRFVTKTKSFEHEERPSSLFGSSTSTNDFSSQCTLSTGVPSLQNLPPQKPPKEQSHQDISNLKTNNSLPVKTSCQSSSHNNEVVLSEALLEALRTPSSPASDDVMYNFS